MNSSFKNSQSMKSNNMNHKYFKLHLKRSSITQRPVEAANAMLTGVPAALDVQQLLGFRGKPADHRAGRPVGMTLPGAHTAAGTWRAAGSRSPAQGGWPVRSWCAQGHTVTLHWGPQLRSCALGLRSRSPQVMQTSALHSPAS